MPTISGHLQQRVMAALHQEVFSGFPLDEELLIDDFLALFAEEHLSPAALCEFVRGGLQDLFLEYIAAQHHWPQRTDCDRLDETFEELTALGIVARHHFWCTNAVALSMLGDELLSHDERTAHGKARGYVYYNEQDTWLALQGTGLFLHFGSLEGQPEDDARIGGEILRALARHGLPADYPSPQHDLIRVDLAWQRRRQY